MLRRWLWLAVLPGVLLPDRGEACAPDPCQGVVAFAGLELAEDVAVPLDGVVVLQAYWFGDYSNQELIEGLVLDVEHAGAPVAGALEATEIGGVLVWRPAEPLVAGGGYRIRGSFRNPPGVPKVCAAAEVEVDLEFVVADEPATPVKGAGLYATERIEEVPRDDLESLVCCDGAMPYVQEVCGIDHGLAWSEGACVTAQADRRLRVDLRDLIQLDEVTESQWMRTLFQNGKLVGRTLGTRFTRYITERTCFAVELRNLATGEVFVSSQECAGELAGSLDEVVIDPLPILNRACEGAPYTCAVVDGAWDPEDCTPWESAEESGEERATPPLAPGLVGCTCAAGGAAPGLWPVLSWPLLSWLLLLRRRARRE
ncbi:MAG TPA: hypothetical protein VIK91_09295 [Nannocystis sp.]